MERANDGTRVTTLRGRHELRRTRAEDVDAIDRLLRRADVFHQHADWSGPLEWVGSPGTVVAAFEDRMTAFLAIAADPLPVAWIRVIALPASSLRALLPEMITFVEPELAKEGVTTIACLTVDPLLQHCLEENRFHAIAALEELAFEMTGDVMHLSLPQGVDLRDVRGDEFGELAEVDQRAFSHPMWWHSADQLRKGAAHAMCFTVAELDGRPVGFHYSTRGPGNTAHLVRLTVDSRYQRRGIGRALLADAIAAYIAAGVKRVTLNTQIDNASARRLYTDVGFFATGSRFGIWSRQVENQS